MGATLVLAVSVMLVLAGLILGGAAAVGVSGPSVLMPGTRGAGRPRVDRVWLVAAAVGLGLFVLTGWVPVAAGGAVASVLLPSILHAQAAAEAQTRQLEALSFWTRRIAELLRSGAATSLQDALTRSAESAQPAIRDATRALAARLGPQGTEPALRAFAREVGHPIGDHIAMALIIRARHGGRGLANVLAELATDVDASVRMQRHIMAERKKPISNIRTIVVLTIVMWAGLLLLARDFLTAYDSPGGQVALAVIVGLFLGCLLWMRAMTRPHPGTRLLTGDAPGNPRTPASGTLTPAAPDQTGMPGNAGGGTGGGPWRAPKVGGPR